MTDAQALEPNKAKVLRALAASLVYPAERVPTLLGIPPDQANGLIALMVSQGLVKISTVKGQRLLKLPVKRGPNGQH